MKYPRDTMSAILNRERSRTRMRVATVTVGAAALATAGVVAYNLPAPAPRKVVANTVVTPATTQPSTPVARYSGDDGGDGATRRPTTVPGSTATKAPSHTTSGGS
jgi:hypothetical protein